MSDFIPVTEPLLDGNENKYRAECIGTGWISSEGPFFRRFDQEFAARMGRKHGVAVCDGAAALDAAVDALDIGPGDEVILPAFQHMRLFENQRHPGTERMVRRGFCPPSGVGLSDGQITKSAGACKAIFSGVADTSIQ